MDEIKIVYVDIKKAMSEENIKASEELYDKIMKNPNIKIGYFINPLFHKIQQNSSKAKKQ